VFPSLGAVQIFGLVSIVSSPPYKAALHLDFPRADWHSAFETDLEQAADQLSELADRILDRRRREGADNEKKRLGHYVAQLLALLSNLSTAMQICAKKFVARDAGSYSTRARRDDPVTASVSKSQS
jgi:uncharacterized membrane protein YccC